MKNLRVLLITSLVSLALLSYADNNKHPQAKKITRIAIEQVRTVPGLTGAIYSQVSPAFLKIEHPGYYNTIARHKGNTYYVYGSRKAWLRFFRMKPVPKGVGSNGFSILTQGNL